MPSIHNDQLSVEIDARGAELRSIRDGAGAEWLWQGDPAYWTGRAPLLFPVVGRSPGGAVTIAGNRYEMAPHGFARSSEFRIREAGADHVTLELGDSTATREVFPFAFRLETAFRLSGAGLVVTSTVTNADSRPMPFQFGYHPAFVWPLPGAAGQRHLVRLGNGGEPALCRLNSDFLLGEARLPSPFRAGELAPEAAMFTEDAMVFPEGIGAEISFAAEGGARVRMSVENLPHFALWQKPGAPYLCLEPWQGTAPFVSDGASLEARHGSVTLAPGASREFVMAMEFRPGA